MKVFVVGANGQIGQHLIRLLRESDEHTVRAMVRKKEQAEFFENLGADKTLLVDLDGAVKTMEAAEKIGTKRFIMVSAIQAHRRENWNDKIKHYYVAKHYADKILEQSDLWLRKQFQFRPVRMCLEPPLHVTECPERATQLTVGVAPFTPTLKANHSIKTDLFKLPKQRKIV
jgi:hypothetical protein